MDKPTHSQASSLFSPPWNLMLALLAILLAATVVLLPVLVQEVVPRRDSGVFLYIGQQILDGKIPYRDAWDHKGPLIYYINALGLWASDGSKWGVWSLELLSLMAAAATSLYLFWEAMGPLPAILGSLTWLMAVPMLLQGGNLTEEYALPLQFAALLFFYLGMRRRSSRPFLFAGITAAMALLLRLNIAGVWLAIGGYLLLQIRTREQRPFYLHSIAALAVGAAIGVVLPLFYFASRGALDELVSGALVFNLLYVDTALADKLGALRYGLFTGISISIRWPALFMWIAGLVSVAGVHRSSSRSEPLVVLGLLALPVELLLSSLSGRVYGHYYLSWLPILGLLAANFYHTSVPSVRAAILRIKTNTVMEQPLLTSVALAVGTISLLSLVQLTFANVDEAVSSATLLFHGSPATAELDESGQGWAPDGPNDTILFWGAEATQNFLLGIPSPTRYVYQYPLYHCRYAEVEMVEEFLGDIIEHQPVIVDTSATNLHVPPVAPVSREGWMASLESTRQQPGGCDFLGSFDPVFTYLELHYVETGLFGSKPWPIYIHVTETQAGQ